MPIPSRPCARTMDKGLIVRFQMRYSATPVVVLLACLTLLACEQAQLITKADLMAKTRDWKEPKVAIWYYTGTGNGFDYFLHRDIDITELYKVTTNEIDIHEHFHVTKDQIKWVPMPWGPHALK